MNILYIVPSDMNVGPVNVVRSMIAESSKVNSVLNVAVLCLKSKNKAKGFSCDTYYLPDEFRDKINFISKLLKELKIDIIHSHGFKPDILGTYLKKRFGLKHVTTIHNSPIIDYPFEYGKFKGFLGAFSHLLILGLINTRVSCSESVGKALSLFHLDSITVRNGVPRIFAEERGNDFEQVVFLGRLIERKNPFEFIRLANNFHLRKFEGDLKFLVLGGGELLNQLQSEGGENTKFLGEVSNPSDYLIESSILISTSRGEGFPLSVLEAIQCGCRVLLSDIPPHLEARDFIGEDVVWIYDQTDPHDLESKLSQMLHQDYRVSDLDKYNCSSERMMKEYCVIYESL